MSEEEYSRLLKQFPDKLKGVLNWKKYFERLVGAGRKTGRSDIQIGDDVRKELKGQLDDRTIRGYLPQSMKHMEHDGTGSRSGSTKQLANNNKINLPDIPPMKHTVKEVVSAETGTKDVEKLNVPSNYYGKNVKPDKPFTEEEREKVHEIMDESITPFGSLTKVKLNCNHFRNELRIALINGDTKELTIKNNEVVKIA